MARRKRHGDITHTPHADDPQNVLRPDNNIRVVLFAFIAGLLVLALMVVIVIVVM